MDNKISRTIYFPLLSVIVLVKLWLIAGVAISAIGIAGHDDQLYARIAAALLQGDWLGAYDNRILAKPPLYSLWLAFNYFTGLPLLVGQALLQILAAGVLVLALGKTGQNRWLLLILFALLVFNPVFMLRVVREGIYPALSLLVLAGFVGLYAYRADSLAKLAGWAVLAGLALAAFWLTREEGVWMLPSLLLLSAYTLYRLHRESTPRLVSRILLCLLPFALWGGVLHTLALANKIYYGAYVTAELKSAPFLAAYGALARVEHPWPNRYLPVPKEVRRQIYAVSPAFGELEGYLEGPPGEMWGANNCQFYPDTCGDIGRGWFHWALRDAVAWRGHYSSYAEASAYYLRLAGEVNTACDEGRLACGPWRKTLAPSLETAHLPWLAKAFLKGANFLSRFMSGKPVGNSVGPPESLVLFEELTHNRLAPLPAAKENAGPGLSVTGWAFSPHDPALALQVVARANPAGLGEFSLARHGGEEVYGVHKHENAKSARFFLHSTCQEDCEWRIYGKAGLLASIGLNDPAHDWQSFQEVFFNVEAVRKGAFPSASAPSPARQDRLDRLRLEGLGKIAFFYRNAMPFLLYLSLAAYLLLAVLALWRGRITFLFILATAVLGAAAARLFILSFIEVTSFPAVNAPLYLAPLYSLALVFPLVALAGLFASLYPRISAKND
jgi:hypothetical protein